MNYHLWRMGDGWMFTPFSPPADNLPPQPVVTGSITLSAKPRPKRKPKYFARNRSPRRVALARRKQFEKQDWRLRK